MATVKAKLSKTGSRATHYEVSIKVSEVFAINLGKLYIPNEIIEANDAVEEFEFEIPFKVN